MGSNQGCALMDPDPEQQGWTGLIRRRQVRSGAVRSDQAGFHPLSAMQHCTQLPSIALVSSVIERGLTLQVVSYS